MFTTFSPSHPLSSRSVFRRFEYGVGKLIQRWGDSSFFENRILVAKESYSFDFWFAIFKESNSKRKQRDTYRIKKKIIW